MTAAASWTLRVPVQDVDSTGTARVLVQLSDGSDIYEVSVEVTPGRALTVLAASPEEALPLQFVGAWSNR